MRGPILFSLGEVLRRTAAHRSAALDRLIQRLTDPDPARRPSDAAEVVEALQPVVAGGAPRRKHSAHRTHALIAGKSTVGGKARTLVGRDRELARYAEFLRTLETREPGPRVIAVTGRPGVGRHRLVREMTWRAQLAASVVQCRAFDASPVGMMVARAQGDAEPVRSLAEVVAAVHALEQADTPLVFVIDDAEALGASERSMLEALARLLNDTGAIGMVVSAQAAVSATQAAPGASAGFEVPRLHGTEVLELAPLDLPALSLWTQGALDQRALQALLAYSGGYPAYIEFALGEMAAGRLHAQDLRSGRRGMDARLELEWNGAESPEDLALLCALDGEVDLAKWPKLRQAFGGLQRTGLVVRDQAVVRLVRRADLESLSRWVGEKAIRHAHRRVAEMYSEEAPTDPRVVRHWALAGEVERAEALVREHAEPSTAWVEATGPLEQRTRNEPVLLAIADIRVNTGAAARALSPLAKVLRRRRSAEVETRARLLAADAYVQLGKARCAERQMQRLLRDHAADEMTKAQAWERLARARIQCGDYRAAADLATRSLEHGDDTVRALAYEDLGIASAYLGDWAGSQQAWEQAWNALTGPRERCRLLAHKAIAAFRHGHTKAALESHAEAMRMAEAHDLPDLVAVGALNLGTVLQQIADLGGAVASYERGLDMARAIGRQSTELTLRYNLANVYAEIGAFDRAETMLDRLERAATAAGLEHFSGAIALLRAEIALALSDARRADALLTQAGNTFDSQQRSRERLEVDLRRVEVHLAKDDAARARALAEDLLKRADADNLRIAAAIARARTGIAMGDKALVPLLSEALDRSTRIGHKLLEAEVEATFAAYLSRTSDGAGATEHGDRARRLWDQAASGLPASLRDVFWTHPRRAPFMALTRMHEVRPPDHADAQALRRLLAMARRINSSLSLDSVLQYAVDAAIELTGAERGFLLLADTAEPRVVVARPASAASDGPSRGIVARALSSESPVLTTDAKTDERFVGRGSVHAMRLKSVVCVPIPAPGGLLGALYLDNRLQRGRFAQADLERLTAFADQTAIAIQNARLVAQLERHARELEQQKKAIEKLSRGQARELERLQQEVQTHRSALSMRYDYSSIAGRGPAMRTVLEKLDRVMESDVPVLIEGESGTGKELVARALHYAGPRKDEPFVAVNCAALPEPLLESELFGHLRGAFSGADRDKEGLLATARAGTLFLDELGEMPLSIQAKLLRVLQEKEIRPVGATRTAPFRARVICATNRSLTEELAAGRFREDLFYRIAVVAVLLPPLRERLDDVPELCRTILERRARASHCPVPDLAADALRALLGHRWPGNVRELENVLTRALILCAGGKRITAREIELTPHRAAVARASTRKDYQCQERDRMLDALTAARWNVAEAARAMRIPRNTFYRKLTLYGLARQRSGPH